MNPNHVQEARMFCTCQQVSKNVFDCPVHGAQLKASSVAWKAQDAAKHPNNKNTN